MMGDALGMSSRKPWYSRKWHAGDICALTFLLSGLIIVLFVAITGGERAVWTLWIAVPMLMFSLAYLFLVSALPIFLGPRSDDESEEDASVEEEGE